MNTHNNYFYVHRSDLLEYSGDPTPRALRESHWKLLDTILECPIDTVNALKAKFSRLQEF